MKRAMLLFTAMCLLCGPSWAWSSQGVEIQRVFTNTRAELGQLATSDRAKEIAELLKEIDRQYETWSQTCGQGANFDPDNASDTCRQMAEQMRKTAMKLYGLLAEYLPEVVVRYEKGAQGASRVVQKNVGNQTPGDLYQQTMDGIDEAPILGTLSPGEADSPFDLEMEDYPDPTDEMFAVLEKLVPDPGKEIPETVRAGNIQVSMMKKAKRARYLADRFERAKFALQSQQEYGKIIFNVTEAVRSMPELLGIQYTGARLTAKPSQKVLEYYRNKHDSKQPGNSNKMPGGFKPRS